MKKHISLTSILLFAIVATGCVQTIYTKSTTVKKDADGKIISIEETESVSQPGVQTRHVSFEHLKAAANDTAPLSPK